MKCKLCNSNTQCSCRGWWCKTCKSSNTQISVMNALLDFWLPRNTLLNNLEEVHSYTGKIDNYTLYEYFNWDIDKTKLDELVSEYKPNVYTTPKKEVIPFKQTENEWKMCVYNESWPWARCIHCWNYRRYFEKRWCPMAKDNLNNNETE